MSSPYVSDRRSYRNVATGHDGVPSVISHPPPPPPPQETDPFLPSPRAAGSVKSGGMASPRILATSSSVDSNDKATIKAVVSNASSRPFLHKLSSHWVPSQWEEDHHHHDNDNPQHHHFSVDGSVTGGGGGSEAFHLNSIYDASRSRQYYRSVKRRFFLLLTEPETSIASAAFFVTLVVAITSMNVIMVMQTMTAYQWFPTDCRTCGGPVSYVFDNDDDQVFVPDADLPNNVPCVCPPAPQPWTENALRWLVYFFTVEWTLRVLSFEPPPEERARTVWGGVGQWFGYVTSTATVLDALSIFPYYLELSISTNSLMSLRLLRLFRVFQLLRLGQYNQSFHALTVVMGKAIPSLQLLMTVLCFGAALFGSMMFWLEKGEWKYIHSQHKYAFVRLNAIGEEEISPFHSIPAAFWWFVVSSTTVGYGDMYPTSVMGRWVATFAMLAGVLVIAFPVSVFSDLWSHELKKRGALVELELDDASSVGGGGGVATHANMPLTKSNEEMPSIAEGGRAAAAAAVAAWNESSDSLPEFAATTSNSRNLFDRNTKGRLTLNSRQFGVTHQNFYGGFERGGSSSNQEKMVLNKDDWAELVAEIATVQESQKRIRALLRKITQNATMGN